MSDSIQYELIEPNIHYYKWQKTDIDTFITYVMHSRQLVSTDTNETQDIPSLKILLNLSIETFPNLDELVSFTVDQSLHSRTFHKEIKRTIAYLSDDRDLPQKIDYLTTLTTIENKRKFFKTTQKNDAIAWLLEQEI